MSYKISKNGVRGEFSFDYIKPEKDTAKRVDANYRNITKALVEHFKNRMVGGFRGSSAYPDYTAVCFRLRNIDIGADTRKVAEAIHRGIWLERH